MSEKQVVSHSVTYRTADENDDGQRLDNYLARILKGGASQHAVQNLASR